MRAGAHAGMGLAGAARMRDIGDMPALRKRPRSTPPGLLRPPPSTHAGLNEAQAAAVTHTDGPLLVLAGAGSGKTRVIISRIARLIAEGVAPAQILAVTFTNKAAKEMRERLALMAGQAAVQVRLCTFHALGLSILREEHEAAGLKKHFAIYDTADLMGVVRELTRQGQLADRRLDVQRLLDHLQAAKRAGLAEVPLQWGDDYELAAYDLYPRYLAQMRAFGAIDFDDLILRSTRVLAQPDVAARWRHRFAHVLVDEYQDTSPDQLALMQSLVPAGGNVCAVGDDDQAIYAWRGAAADNIGAFVRAFPGAKQVILTANYRSTAAILSAANAVIAHNTARTAKVLQSQQGEGEPVEVVQLSTCEEEASFVAERIHALLGRGHKAEDVAVLFRANSQSRLLEETLRAERIPTRVVGGQSLFDRKETRDLFAFLQLCVTPHDEVALRRVINVPPRGIGPTTLERLTGHADGAGVSLWQALAQAPHIAGLPAQAVRGAQELRDALIGARAQFAQAGAGNIADIAEQLVTTLGMHRAIDTANETSSLQTRRHENLHSGVRSLGRYATRAQARDDAERGIGCLLGFLRAQSLRQDAEDENEPQGAVHLMTVHAAKGLEFPYVFVVGLEEGLLPHKRSLEDWQAGKADTLCEERRLCYVAITRARHKLYLTHARHRRKHGRLEDRTPSRFLQELPDSVVRRTHDGPCDDDNDEARQQAAAEHFFASMRIKLGIDAPADPGRPPTP